jgi:hypothetical protein
MCSGLWIKDLCALTLIDQRAPEMIVTRRMGNYREGAATVFSEEMLVVFISFLFVSRKSTRL